MKKFVIGMALAFLATNSFAANVTVQGKVLSLYPCQDSTGFALVELDNGNTYRMSMGSSSTSSLVGMRRAIYSTLLMAFERDYTITIESTTTADSKCGQSTFGIIQGLKLEKALN